MTTFNFDIEKPSICVDCSAGEAIAFEAHVADLDRRITAARNRAEMRVSWVV